MVKKEEFADLIMRKLIDASAKQAKSIRLNAGELHRELGGYPSTRHALTSCCDAMYEARRPSDTIVSAPPKGRGATLTIEYKLPR